MTKFQGAMGDLPKVDSHLVEAPIQEPRNRPLGGPLNGPLMGPYLGGGLFYSGILLMGTWTRHP